MKCLLRQETHFRGATPDASLLPRHVETHLQLRYDEGSQPQVDNGTWQYLRLDEKYREVTDLFTGQLLLVDKNTDDWSCSFELDCSTRSAPAPALAAKPSGFTFVAPSGPAPPGGFLFAHQHLQRAAYVALQQLLVRRRHACGGRPVRIYSSWAQ